MSFEHYYEEPEYTKDEYLNTLLGYRAYGGYGSFVDKKKMPLVLVPKEDRTLDICMNAIRNDPENIRFVPDELKESQSFWDTVITIRPVLFPQTPEKYRSKSVCYHAVCYDVSNLRHCPPEMVDRETLYAAVRSGADGLRNIPEGFLDKELCMMAVSRFPRCIQVVPEKFLEYDLYLLAVQGDGSMIRVVPEEHLERKLCLEAVQGTRNRFDIRMVMSIVTERFSDRGFLLEALERNFMGLCSIPENQRDEQLCMAAFRDSPEAIVSLIPEKHRTKELWAEAIRRMPKLIRMATKEIRDPYFFLELIQKECRNAVLFLPKEYKMILAERVFSDDPEAISALHGWSA